MKIIKSGWVRRTLINWQSIFHQDCTLPRLQRFMRFKGESCCPSSQYSCPPHLLLLVKHDAQAEDKLAALWPSEADHHLWELTTCAAASPHQLPVTKFIKSHVSFDNSWWDRETSYQFRKYLRSDCCCAKVCLSRFIFNLLNQSHDRFQTVFPAAVHFQPPACFLNSDHDVHSVDNGDQHKLFSDADLEHITWLFYDQGPYLLHTIICFQKCL